MEQKKVIYIAGPITGKRNYWEDFERAEDMLTGLGYIALTPSRLPKDLPDASAMHICFGMINAADAVLLLPDWTESRGANLEAAYCSYIKKPTVSLKVRNLETFSENPPDIVLAWLKHDLEEVLKT